MMPLARPGDIKDGEVRIRVCVDEYELHRNSNSRIIEVRASLKDVKNPEPELSLIHISEPTRPY